MSVESFGVTGNLRQDGCGSPHGSIEILEHQNGGTALRVQKAGSIDVERPIGGMHVITIPHQCPGYVEAVKYSAVVIVQILAATRDGKVHGTVAHRTKCVANGGSAGCAGDTVADIGPVDGILETDVG